MLGGMSEHKASIRWNLADGDFAKGRYSRAHTWAFDGGLTVAASSSPAAVPVPMSDPANIDPEEAFVASLSSCHMLTYLYLCYREKFQVASYEDDAVGVMTKNEHGVPWVSTAYLNPRVVYQGTAPSHDDEVRLHHAAHEGCFISQSVKTDVQVRLGGDT
jgi:organic hydroperoxide reductase OsmC/OhrA